NTLTSASKGIRLLFRFQYPDQMLQSFLQTFGVIFGLNSPQNLLSNRRRFIADLIACLYSCDNKRLRFRNITPVMLSCREKYSQDLPIDSNRVYLGFFVAIGYLIQLVDISYRLLFIERSMLTL